MKNKQLITIPLVSLSYDQKRWESGPEWEEKIFDTKNYIKILASRELPNFSYGIEVKDPSFNMDAVWVERHKESEAESNGYVVVEPESVLATHLSQIMYKFAADLIGQDDVQKLLDNLSQSSPSLVESVVPKLIPLHTLTGII